MAVEDDPAQERAPDAFRVLQRSVPSAIAALPLSQRLPDVELAVGNDETPSLVDSIRGRAGEVLLTADAQGELAKYAGFALVKCNADYIPFDTIWVVMSLVCWRCFCCCRYFP